MKKLLFVLIGLFLVFIFIAFIYIINEKDNQITNLPLDYSESFRDKLFDIKFNVEPEPEINSISSGKLILKSLKHDLNIQVHFSAHPSIDILSNQTYDIKATLNDDITIPISLKFKELGASGLYTVVSITHDDSDIAIQEEILKTYFYIPSTNINEYNVLNKTISFDEQYNFPRISKFPSKAHKPIPFTDK